MSKKCIWCIKDSSKASFYKKAHTIPKSLGGIYICKNVCDECNHYFGSPSSQMPAIELVFKEIFNITRTRLLMGTNEVGGKNKILPRFKSQFFSVDFEKNKIDIKFSFKLKKGFQSNLCRQFRRGLYKVFLEETDRQNSNGFDIRFNFIRKFSRYNVGDLPILYYHRKLPLILIAENEAQYPEFRFSNKMNYETKEFGFFDIEFLGHLFSFPIVQNWEEDVKEYLNNSLLKKEKNFHPPILVEYITDIDLTLYIMND